MEEAIRGAGLQELRELRLLRHENAKLKAKQSQKIFPALYRKKLEGAKKLGNLDAQQVRVDVDMISSMTERQVIRLDRRLVVSVGSVLDSIN